MEERVLTSIEIPQRNVYHCILYSRCNFYTCDRNEEKPLYIYIYFKTWAKFNADIFVRVQRWAIYWFLKCKALEI